MKTALTNPWTFIAFCLALPVTAYSVVKFYEVYYEPPGKYTTVPGTSLAGLTDQHDEVIRNASDDDIRVVNFFFTSCPVVCVKMMKNLKHVHNVYKNDDDVNITSITVDPQTDTPERLRWYINKMDIDDRNWQMLTGDKKKIYTLARNDFKVAAADTESDFIHSDKLVLIDRSGVIRGYYDGLSTIATEQLIKDIKKLKTQ